MVMTSFSYFSFHTRLFNFFPTWSFNIFRFLSSFLWRRINFIFYSFICVIRRSHRFRGHSRQRYLRSKKLIRKCQGKMPTNFPEFLPVRIIFNNRIWRFWNEFESSDTRNLEFMNNYFSIQFFCF